MTKKGDCLEEILT